MSDSESTDPAMPRLLFVLGIAPGSIAPWRDPSSPISTWASARAVQLDFQPPILPEALPPAPLAVHPQPAVALRTMV